MIIRLSPDVAAAIKNLKQYELEPINDVLRRLIGKSAARKAKTKTKQKELDLPQETAADLWQVWSAAYRQRYGVDYPRNAKVNSQLKQLSIALGADAEEVIRFYLTSNDAWLLKTKHALGNLVKSPESWHVRWQGGQHTISDKLAREAEKAATADDEMRIAREKVKRIFSFFENNNENGGNNE